jgi:serpin B
MARGRSSSPMKSPLRPLLKLLCLLCCGGLPAIADTGWIGNSTDQFALDLYAKLAADNQENLFFSPASIQTALAMTDAGARGQTAAQMAAVLQLPPGSGAMHKDFGGFLNGLNGPGAGATRGYELSVANALWGQQGYPFLPAFLDLLKASYGAGLREVDFKGNSEAARQTINAWVEKKTAGKITDLIGAGVLTSLTRLVLTNAIYFKGTWETQFDKKETRDEPFHPSADRAQNTPMMHRTASYGYLEDAQFQALKLPYAGKRLSMIILLPRHPDGLPELEKALTAEKLKQAFAVFREQKVAVTIPKFKLAGQFELGPALQAMGMKLAFSGDADFSGMTGKPDLSISNVIHKSYVEVNEEGTVAAAATGVVMTFTMAFPNQPPIFRADHPFIFVIRDEASGAFLFMGRVTDPE